MIHNIKNNDIIKVLPFITKSGEIKWSDSVYILSCNTKDFGHVFLYDDTNFLNKLYFKSKSHNTLSKVFITKKHFLHGYTNGESKLFGVGRKIFDILKNTNLNVSDNTHLLVKEKDVILGGHDFKSYDDSTTICYDWTPPALDISSKTEWFEWLKNNQPEDIISYATKNGRYVRNNIDKLNSIFGADMVSEVIQEEREGKLNLILD